LSPYQIKTLSDNITNLIVFWELVENDSWFCSVTPNDGYVDGQTKNSSSAIIDSMPTVNNISIMPAFPDTSTDLACIVTVTDFINSTLILEWTWYNGTEMIYSGNMSGVTKDVNTQITSLGNLNTTQGEIWNCTVRAYDGVYYSDYSSISTYIGNALPTVNMLTFSPNFSNASSNIQCNATISDADQSAVTVEYWWYKNSAFTFGGNITDISVDTNTVITTLGSENTELGELWNCTIRAYDGFEYSSFSSIITTIEDMPSEETEQVSEITSRPIEKTENYSTIKANYILQSPKAGEYSFNITIDKIAFNQIKLEFNDDISDMVILSIEKVSTLPITIAQLENTYQFLRIEKTIITDSNISDIAFKFKVEKSWISDNNINPGTVALYRYTTRWDKLVTRQKSIDSKYYHYEAYSPGMSYFAIKGEKIEELLSDQETKESNQVSEIINQEEILQPEISSPAKITPSKTGFPYILSFVVFGIIATGIMIFILFRQKTIVEMQTQKQEDSSTFQSPILTSSPESSKVRDAPLEEMKEYIEKCKSRGALFYEIKENLKKGGWPDALINTALNNAKIPHEETERLKKYILEMKKQGISDEIIKSNLSSVGWSKQVIQIAFSK
jgi:PGF-pre-PGF domain-containing protein